MKEKIKQVMFLAISVGIFVPIWGTFHYLVGINNTWAAFASAALFFTVEHKLSGAIKVAVCNSVGLLWGIMLLYIMSLPALQNYNSTLVGFGALCILGILSILVTSTNIKVLSHTPSLFCGWAVAVGALGNTPINNWGNAPLDILLSLLIGVFFVAGGILLLSGGLVKSFCDDAEDSASEIKHSDSNEVALKKSNKNSRLSLTESKMNRYINSFSSIPKKDIEGENKLEFSEDISDLKREIIELKDFIGNKTKDQAFSSSGSQNYKDVQVKIVGVCGSPHKKGSTIEYLKTALEAAESLGNVTVELIELAGKEIKPCMGCRSDKCHGTCRIDDHMQELYPKLRDCDGLILASPSYFGTFSGQLKLFLDRLRVMRHTDFQLGNKVIGTIAVAGRRHGGQEITNMDLIQTMMRHNTIIVNDGTAVCQLGATGWSHTFDDPNVKVEDDNYGLQTAVGVGKRVAEIAKVVKSSGLKKTTYQYNAKIGKR